MTTADLTSEAHPAMARPDFAGNGAEPHWTDQAVLSGAGLLNGGLQRSRVVANSLIDVADALVLGSLDVLDEWNSVAVQIMPALTTRPTGLARKVYVSATAALRKGVSEL